MNRTEREGLRQLARDQSRWSAEMAEQAGSQSIADIVSQQRRRARSARFYSSWVLAVLIVTILLGLAYYVALPLWQQSRQAFDESAYARAQDAVADKTAALTALDARRNDAWQAVAKTLEFTATTGDTGAGNDLYALQLLPDGRTLIAVGWDGVFARSTDAGATWVAGDTGAGNHLSALQLLPDGMTLIAVGLGGVVVTLGDQYAVRLRTIAPVSGSEGYDAFEAGLQALPGFLFEEPETRVAIEAFRAVVAQRGDLQLDLAEAEAARNEIRLGSLERAQAEEEFRTFIATCRGDPPTISEWTKDCVTAYATLQGQKAGTIWQTLAQQVPPAILLLFLLATLGGLYRYNLRLAGFHHSRADALEMLAMGKVGADVEHLVKLSDALAADKVEFGKANTPADQAVEMFKAFMARTGK